MAKQRHSGHPQASGGQDEPPRRSHVWLTPNIVAVATENEIGTDCRIARVGEFGTDEQKITYVQKHGDEFHEGKAQLVFPEVLKVARTPEPPPPPDPGLAAAIDDLVKSY